MSRSNNRPAPPDFTPGPWIFEPADRGDDSVGIPPTPPYIYADPECDWNVYPVCMLDEPVRRAGRDPVDEYDECLESSGTVAGNAALIAAAPDLLAALREMVAHEDERIAKNGEDWALTPAIRKRTAKARAAIAKAGAK